MSKFKRYKAKMKKAGLWKQPKEQKVQKAENEKK